MGGGGYHAKELISTQLYCVYHGRQSKNPAGLHKETEGNGRNSKPAGIKSGTYRALTPRVLSTLLSALFSTAAVQLDPPSLEHHHPRCRAQKRQETKDGWGHPSDC